jgi:hypothetical protein
MVAPHISCCQSLSLLMVIIQVADVDVVLLARLSFASLFVQQHHVVVVVCGRHRVGTWYNQYDDNYNSNNSRNDGNDNEFYCVIMQSRLRPCGLGCRCCCGRKYAAAAAATWDAGQQWQLQWHSGSGAAVVVAAMAQYDGKAQLGLRPCRLGQRPCRLGQRPCRLGQRPRRLGLRPHDLGCALMSAG